MEIEALRKLHGDLWTTHHPCDGSPEWAHESRMLTDDEWEAIVEAIERLKLIVQPHNACFGFGLGITLSEQPTVPGIKPLGVMCITQEHLATKLGPDSYEAKHGGGHMRFDEAWNTFEPLFNTERNHQLLAYHKLDPVQERSYYVY